MSVAGIPQDHPDRNILKKPFHRRNDSGELDVFEAARYFSGYNDATSSFTQKMSTTKEDNRSWRGGRISLDMPIRHVINPQHDDDRKQSNIAAAINNKDKKCKQPSSPGGRLASFLNSLFSQSSSKKKSKSTQSAKDEQEESGRRKRRSSVSHFRISSSTAVADNSTKPFVYSSGFRTPPAYAQTPTKSYKDFKTTFVATKQNTTTNNATSHVAKSKDKAEGSALSCKDKVETYPAVSVSSSSTSSSQKKLGFFTRFDEEFIDDDVDDGGDSDSSSDLFELQNYDLGGCYSSGLPVYETTNMDSIKRGAPISSA